MAWRIHSGSGFLDSFWRFMIREIRSAFHLNWKIGFSGGKPNGTGLSTENFSKKRNTFRGIPLFSFSPELPENHCTMHLLYHTSTMLLGKNKRFRSRMSSSFMFECQYAVFILNKRNVFWRHRTEKKQSYHLATKSTCIDFLGQYTFRNEPNHSQNTAKCNQRLGHVLSRAKKREPDLRCYPLESGPWLVG